MKKNSIIVILFPGLFMTIITITSFSNILESYSAYFKGLFILSLILLFPFLFLIQGIICALSLTNIFWALGVSIFSFITLMVIYLNSTALIYILIYLILGITGYLINNYITKGNSSNNS